MLAVAEKKVPLQPPKIRAIPFVKRVFQQVRPLKQKVGALHKPDEKPCPNLVGVLPNVRPFAARVKHPLHHVVYRKKKLLNNVDAAVKQFNLRLQPLKQKRQQVDDAMRPQFKRTAFRQVRHKFLRLPKPLQRPFLYAVVVRLLLVRRLVLLKHGVPPLAVGALVFPPVRKIRAKQF